MQSIGRIPKLASLVYGVFEGTCARSPLINYMLRLRFVQFPFRYDSD